MFSVAIALFCSFLWAGVTVATKMLTTVLPDLPAPAFAFIRYTLVTLFLLPAFVLQKEYLHLKADDIPGFMTLGLLLVLIFNLLFFTALWYAPATSVATIGAVNPLCLMLLAALLGQFTPTRLQLFSFLLTFIGVVLVVTHGNLGYAVFAESTGELYTLAAVACQTVYAIVLRRVSLYYSTLFVTFGTAFTGILYVFPFVANGAFIDILRTLSAMDWLLFGFISLFGSALAIFLYANAMKQLGPVRSSLIVFTTMPIFAAMQSHLLLGEILTGWQLVGGSLVIVALALGLRQPG